MRLFSLPARPSLRALSTRLGLCVALASAGSAANASVVWQLNNFTFTDSATATGSFTWDEAANVATAWNIVTGAGTLTAQTYANGSSSMYVSQSTSALTFYVGNRQLRIGFANVDALDTPSSHLALSATNPGQVGANGFLECFNCAPYRLGQAGAYVSAGTGPVNVPEPSTAALSVLALALLASRVRTGRKG